MALLRVDFYSHYLERNVVLTVVIPADKMDGDKLAKKRRGPYRTVYLLHGLSDNHTIWMRRTSIERYAAAYGLVVVMPAGPPWVMTRAVSNPPWRPPMIDMITMKKVVGATEGTVTCRKRASGPAPSIAAAS